ncbi:hypothetical protein BC628DRAFT_1368389 [Trametes gibbosa]|nr:hypothetical protein BC628DRAFT_1368389 [Trametes gibbosa]
MPPPTTPPSQPNSTFIPRRRHLRRAVRPGRGRCQGAVVGNGSRLAPRASGCRLAPREDQGMWAGCAEVGERCGVYGVRQRAECRVPSAHSARASDSLPALGLAGGEGGRLVHIDHHRSPIVRRGDVAHQPEASSFVRSLAGCGCGRGRGCGGCPRALTLTHAFAACVHEVSPSAAARPSLTLTRSSWTSPTRDEPPGCGAPWACV